MFGSQALEVAVGLILVFLLVSLILTAVRESIEAFFRTRAVDLERAIAELLGDRDTDPQGIRATFYKHPLIAALYSGDYEGTKFDQRTGKPLVSDRAVWNLLSWVFPVRVKGSRRKPTYIPRQQFAQALLDLARNGKLRGAAARALLALRPPAGGQAVPDGDDEAIRLLAAEAVKAATGKDADALRAEVEVWYDGAMDRASGWYRRRTELILLVLGFVIALLLNINAVTIARVLATDDTLRAAMAELAERTASNLELSFLTEDGNGSAAGATPGEATGTGAAPSDGQTRAATDVTGAEEVAEDRADPAETELEDTTPGEDVAAEEVAANDAETTADNGEAATDEDSDDLDAWGHTRQLHGEFLELGLPIGWGEATRMAMPQEEAGLLEWLLWAVGFLVTAFAATLGAPFWFDVLNKVMVVRSTVKPKEKSGDEGSEDRKAP